MSKGIDHIRFTEGPCEDDDAPEFLKNMRKGASFRARRRSADENLDNIRRQLCSDACAVLVCAPGARLWSDEEIDAMYALVDLVLIHLCNGGLFDVDQDRSSAFHRGSRTAH